MPRIRKILQIRQIRKRFYVGNVVIVFSVSNRHRLKPLPESTKGAEARSQSTISGKSSTGGICDMQNVAIVTSRFCNIYNDWRMLRCGGKPLPQPSPASDGGSKTNSYRYDKGFDGGTGYHLEDHFVTLSQGWR